ncbi:MAG: SdrD B-like domain-containing protein, partial [Gammaproteobacteria bacterium]
VANTSEKDLSHWVLGLDEAPADSSGCNDIKNGLDPTTGVSGWKCDDGQAAGSTQTYAITVSGHVGEAPTRYAVKGGTYFAVGDTTGPGAAIQEVEIPTYSVTGVIFVDANANGTFDNGEPVLPNVTVQLGNQSLKTDEKGKYTFTNLYAGDYSVSVPVQTDEAIDDFNEALATYFEATAGNSLAVSVGPSADNQNFGFNIISQAVLDDFNESDPDGNGFTFTGTGKTIGFWKHQITSAKQGKTKGVQVSAAAVRDYLYNGTTSTSVRSMFIDVFGDMPATDAAFDYALKVLSSTSSNEVDLLKKQLLGTELNHQAGQGLSDNLLQSALLAWSEYMVKEAGSFTRDEILVAKDICDLINNSGE